MPAFHREAEGKAGRRVGREKVRDEAGARACRQQKLVIEFTDIDYHFHEICLYFCSFRCFNSLLMLIAFSALSLTSLHPELLLEQCILKFKTKLSSLSKSNKDSTLRFNFVLGG